MHVCLVCLVCVGALCARSGCMFNRAQLLLAFVLCVMCVMCVCVFVILCVG
jgi:hypothetical protein